MKRYQWLLTECEHCDGDRQKTRREPLGQERLPSWFRLPGMR